MKQGLGAMRLPSQMGPITFVFGTMVLHGTFLFVGKLFLAELPKRGRPFAAYVRHIDGSKRKNSPYDKKAQKRTFLGLLICI